MIIERFKALILECQKEVKKNGSERISEQDYTYPAEG